MPGRKETNVRLPVCAHEALATIAARQGTSRDEAVRRLLSDHVEEQERKDPEDRRTHLSTLLRYPPPPRWRKDPRQDRPLRLRADATLLERAKAVSLRLPGQHRRAHRDYQGRMLTDAVMTAIAVAEPFTDSFLDGLLPLLRQRSALGLWRLVTAATSTGPEETYLVTAGTIRADAWMSDTPLGAGREYLLRVAEHLEREEGWHSSERFKRAVSLARGLLTGPQAKECEHWLYAQDEDFEEVYQDLLQEDDGRGKHVRRGYDWTGRGGTAVWRAERRVDLEDFEDWLVGRGTGDSSVGVMESGSPGWLLSTPPAWQAQAFPRTALGQLPPPYARWAAEGRVLVFPYRSGQAIWPLRRGKHGSGWEPVPGIEPLAAATAGLRPEKVLGFIEAVLVEWNHTFEEEPQQRITLELPVDKAHQFGFVTAEAQHEHMAEARAATLRGMDDFITRFEGTGEAGERVQQLREARGSVRDFSRLARLYGRRKRLGFRPVRATWRWPRGAVVSEVLVGSPPEVVHWLATEAYKQSSLLLEESMQAAWHWAFDRHGFRGDLPTDDVTPTDTESPSPFDELITGHRAITPRGSSAGHADPTR